MSAALSSFMISVAFLEGLNEISQCSNLSLIMHVIAQKEKGFISWTVIVMERRGISLIAGLRIILTVPRIA